MKPVLYNESYTNVIGVLNNCIECYTEEERNGTFSLTLSYPITDSLHNELIYGRVIQCKPNDEQEEQYFRIYNTERIISGLVHVYALHISFDLAYDYVSNIDIQNQSCEYALNTLFRSSQFSSHYKGYSDIVNAQNYKIQNVNLVDAIAGVKGSIIDTFGTGAEIKRDNTSIYVYNKRGTNTGVKIEYGVNLLDESLEVDISELVTSIIGTASYTDSDGNEHVISTTRIDSPNVSNYPHPYILYKDYSDRFTQEEVTENKLINLIEQDYSVNHVDQPKCSYTIDFVPLSRCSGYEDIEDNIHLCDTVRIIDSRYGIDTEAKVIKYKYNVLTERYETMELGDPRNTLNDVITSNTKGEKGEKGEKGDPGADGNIGDFPSSLPDTPILSGECYGFASIELSWTFESQVYYSYELYASKTQGFTPNTFDLIHEGQTSSFLYQARPNETWYFKVCGKNSYGDRTAFSNELKIETYKIDDMTDYFSNIAIGNAVVNSLTADFMTAGVIKGNWIDAKNLSVTDGNGKRTLDIDSYGNVSLDVASLKISSSNVATENYTDTKATQALNDAKAYTTTQITTTNNKVASIETNLSGITSRVSSVETKQTTINNTVTNHESRIKTAESKITDSAIVNTVTSSTNWAKQTSSISTAQSTATTANATANSALSKANTNSTSISTLTTKLTQTEKDFNFKIENVGAENLIKNSDFSAGLEKWGKNGSFTWYIPVNGSEISHNFGKMICIQNSGGGVGIFQRFNTITGQKYTVSFYTEGFQQKPTDTVIGIEGVKTITLNVEPTFKRWSFTFTATSNSHTFVAYLGTAGKFYLGRVMVTQGTVLQEYRKHTSEIYSTTVKIDVDGIEIDSTGANTINKINTDGMVIKDKSDNTDLLKATSSGVVARGGSFYVDDPSNGYTRLWGRDIDINGQRALVGTNSKPQDSLIANKLYINYNGDFKNGTEITGKLTNNTFNVLSDVGSSITQNGYMKLSNGLIIQWGHVMGLEISEGRVVDAHVKYPIDFPNAIITFIPSIDSVDGNNYIASRYNIVGKTNNNRTHGWVYSYNWTDSPVGALMDINYIAIGC